MQDYADWVLDSLDPDRSIITYRLYRQHTWQQGFVNVKDLSCIGRDLAKTVIVDNIAENFRLQIENGIYIKSWFDDMNDTALIDLLPVLVELAKKRVPDVREALQMYRDRITRQIAQGKCSLPLI